nr:MAG TPA: hypothetical protein [Caudoviricetes sp.]
MACISKIVHNLIAINFEHLLIANIRILFHTVPIGFVAFIA